MTLYENKLDTSARGGNQLMIVPFPHDCEEVGEDRLRLVELPNRYIEEKVFKNTALLLKPLSRGFTDGRGLYKSKSKSKVAVAQAGGYKVSLVGSHERLLGAVDWERFSKPANFEEIMEDLRERYGQGYGFVIAEPNRNTDGRYGGTFGWIWYGERAFLPTAHEKMEVPQYDVIGYMLNCNGYAACFEGTDDVVTGLGDIHTNIRVRKSPACDEVTALLESAVMFAPDSPEMRVGVPIGPLFDGIRVELKGRKKHNANVVPVLRNPE